jgi:hypothetical protein
VGEIEHVVIDGDLVASASAVSFDPELDLRRRRPTIALRIRLAVVFEALELLDSDPEDESESVSDSIQWATGPGADSSSMMCCGVLSYM